MIKRISLIAFHRAASGSSFRAHPDAPFLYSKEIAEECVRPAMLLETEGNEGKNKTTIPKHSHEDRQSNLRCEPEGTTADVEEYIHISADTAVL